MSEYLFEEETHKIIGAAQEVHKELGPGFLKAVYQDALEIEFKIRKIPSLREPSLPVFYKTIRLNHNYNADFLCYEKIIVETKAIKNIDESCYAQVLNYLKASKIKLGLLFNFGELKLNVKRIIL